MLKETDVNVVLANVMPCLHPSDAEIEQKPTVRKIDTPVPALLVACDRCRQDPHECKCAEARRCDAVFDRLAMKDKAGVLDRALQICSALRNSSHLSDSGMDFSLQRFNLLMELPTDAYLRCGFLR